MPEIHWPQSAEYRDEEGDALMPEGRLERTRDPKPVVPACIRLGHLMYDEYATATRVCYRCGLAINHVDVVSNYRRGWNEDRD